MAVRQDDAMAIKWERGPGSYLVAEGVPAERVFFVGNPVVDTLVARDVRPVPVADRRGVLITLTPQGRELIDQVTEAHLANERRLLAGLSKGERDRLADLLRKLALTLPPG